MHHKTWQSEQMPWRRPSERQPPVGFPVLIALGFHLIGNWAAAGALMPPRDLLAYVFLVVGPVALLGRHRRPLAVLVVAAAASLGVAVLTAPGWTYAVAPAVALFSALRLGRGRQALPLALAGYLVYVAVLLVFADPLGLAPGTRPDPRQVIMTGVALVVAVLLGGASRSRAAYMAELAKTNAERARARQELERRQTSDERLRIARELHDVLGHHLSLINVQAGVGLHLMESRPEQAREALTAIKTASAEALREVRGVLSALRPDEEEAPRQPALGLDRLDDLTAGAGIPVSTTVSGAARALPAEVDRAAYRIVQEALTNVRRHAAATEVRILVEYGPRDLRLRIHNDGVPPPGGPDDPDEPGAAGSGITGMRARAETLGGSLSAGPTAEGEYVVEAVLPARDVAAAGHRGEPT